MAEIDTPGSPDWWLTRLDGRLADRAAELKRRDDYFEGRHRLAFATGKYREAFGDILRGFSDNWMEKVVTAAGERMIIDGFRFPSETTTPPDPTGADDENDTDDGDATRGDRDAAYLFQANGLDAESVFATTETLALGICYGLVDPTAEVGNRKVAGLTIEHPSQVIVATDPGNRRLRLAALKRWVNDWGVEMATVYLPNKTYRYERSATSGGWVDRKDRIGAEVRNSLGVVPVVAFENRKRLLAAPTAEHENVMPLQDAVNKLVLDLLVASEFSAYVQRWATGIEFDEDVAGNPVPPAWKAGQDRVFMAEEIGAKFGQFTASDLGNFVTAIEMVVQHIAALSSTPPHYLLAKMANLSGDALKAAETGLVAKVRGKTLLLGEPWEEFIRLGFRARNDARADIVDAETIWRDPESRTETERTNAAVLRLSAGVPLQQVWEDLGYSSAQRRRFRTLLIQEAKERLFRGLPVADKPMAALPPAPPDDPDA